MDDAPRDDSAISVEPNNTTLLGLLNLVDDHIGDSEDRVMFAIGEVRGDANAYRREHANLHAAAALLTDEDRRTLRDLIRADEIRQAKINGFLGFVRFMLDLAGRNWPALAAVAAIVGILTGAFHVDIAVTP